MCCCPLSPGGMCTDAACIPIVARHRRNPLATAPHQGSLSCSPASLFNLRAALLVLAALAPMQSSHLILSMGNAPGPAPRATASDALFPARRSTPDCLSSALSSALLYPPAMRALVCCPSACLSVYEDGH